MKKISILVLLAIFMVSCRGWRTEKPPIHPNINFDFQPKIKAQTNPLNIPDNTIQFEETIGDHKLDEFEIDAYFIKNGQKNYNIYCSACHTKTGDGTKSIVSQNGWIASNLLDDVTVKKTDKEIYDIIKNGVRTMPGYGKKLDSKEIWQIVLYVRALQTMTHTLPAERRMISEVKNYGK
jgi:mono/diheme cytochrome c family protein